jgi:prephenate dehydratase
LTKAKSKSRVAFQGEHGAFSEEAALKAFGPAIELVPRSTFAALFSSIEEGLADYVVVPVENSIIGPIRQSVELLSQSSLARTGEIVIPIAQHLIACPGVYFSEIEVVQSHPAALAQCGHFFAAHPHLLKVEAEDTAGSVAQIMKRGDRGVAAIAGIRAAQLYGATVVKADIQDDPKTYTRFVLLAATVEETATNTTAKETKRKSSYAR